MRQWRLINDHPTAGARNMAVDEAILQAVSQGYSLPTLRLYAWTPACLSLGYGQRSSDVDFDRVASRGWDVVRRPTGGRAILHTDELTYSLVLPADHPLAAGSVIDSYRRISAGLTAGLIHLGLTPLADARAERHPVGGAVCFETPSHYEMTVNGRKLIGSAQLRRRGGILQHGTLPLSGDLGRICDALVYASEPEREAAKVQVRAHAITLTEALDTEISWTMVGQAINLGFAETFDIQWLPGQLTDPEVADAERLEREVYSTPEWTRRRHSTGIR